MYDKIIIGAGLYGLYSAERCGKRGEHHPRQTAAEGQNRRQGGGPHHRLGFRSPQPHRRGDQRARETRQQRRGDAQHPG